MSLSPHRCTDHQTLATTSSDCSGAPHAALTSPGGHNDAPPEAQSGANDHEVECEQENDSEEPEEGTDTCAQHAGGPPPAA